MAPGFKGGIFMRFLSDLWNAYLLQKRNLKKLSIWIKLTLRMIYNSQKTQNDAYMADYALYNCATLTIILIN